MEYSVRHAVLITALIAIAGIATAAISGTVAAQSETDIQWTGAGANGFPTTQDIQVEAVDSQNLITFGANTGRSLRVQNVDTGDSITLTPTNTTTYQVEEFELNFNSLVNIQADGEYEKAQDPEMSLTVNQTAPPDYPINVEGDPTKFFEQTFYEYNVQVIDSTGTVIAETDDTKIRGSGYEESYRYNGSAVGVERDPGVQPEWYVILEQYDPDAETTYTYTGDYNENSEYIIFNTDSNFNPNNDFDIVISANETQRIDLENEIISLFGVEVANPEEENKLKIVDGPIGNTDSEPNQDSSDVNIRWTGAGTSGTLTQDIQIEVDDEQNPVSFGANTGRSLRIQNVDTGENITLTPTNATTYEVTEFALNLDGDGLTAENPSIEIEPAQDDQRSRYPIKIDGEPNEFLEETFYEYNVQIIGSDGTVIAETDKTRHRAAKYEVSYEYNGSAIAVERDPGVESDWYVALKQDRETIAVADNDAGDDYFIFNTTNTDFSPNDTFRAKIYPNELQTDLTGEIIGITNGGGLDYDSEFEDSEFVEGPVGNTDSESNQNSSQEVEIRAVNIAPSSEINSDPQEYNLTFEAHNVSADGNKDEFEITFPAEVDLADDPDVSINELSSDPGVNQTGNTVEFTVNPNGTQSVRTLTVSMDVTLSTEGNNEESG